METPSSVPSCDPSKPWEVRLSVTKLDAAQRQLRQAILLFFRQGDVCSVHTLACASSQVLNDTLSAQGAGGLLRNKHLIVDGKQKVWFDSIKKTENFLKHADRDHSQSAFIDSRITILFLLESSILLETASQRVFAETRYFTIWCALNYPEYVNGATKWSSYREVASSWRLGLWADAIENDGVFARSIVDTCTPPPAPTTPYDLYLMNENKSPARTS